MMLPALLGVSVAQISLLINTQIASHLAPGSVSWLNYADRLMEFPTAHAGRRAGRGADAAAGGARAGGRRARYSAMLDWGLRLVVLLAVPCAVALLVFARPLVAVLFHYGAFTRSDVQQLALALMGYGVGLLGLVAIKVLAPGYYASQDIRTPMRIAIVVLVITQLLNFVLVPLLQHAGLALSIGLGALVNAGWLLVGLLPARQLPARAGLGPVRAAGAARPARCSARLPGRGATPFRLDRPARPAPAARRPAGALIARRGAALFRGAVGCRPQAAAVCAPLIAACARRALTASGRSTTKNT